MGSSSSLPHNLKSHEPTTLEIFGLLLLTPASYGGYHFWQQHRQVSAASLVVHLTANLLRDEVASRLTDPDSAEFRSLVLYHTLPQPPSHTVNDQILGEFSLCGEVNSKNLFGGYAGYTPFVSTFYSLGDSSKETRYVFLPHEGNEEVFRRIWREHCQGSESFPQP